MTYNCKLFRLATCIVLILQFSLGAADRKAALHAQTPSRESTTAMTVGTPVVGFVAQSNPPELRPIYGLPGAALLGVPLALPAVVGKVNMAPAQDYALVERNDGAAISVLPVDIEGTGLALEIAGAPTHADRIAYSPDGSKALLYGSEPRKLQLVAGLPSSPQIAAEFDLPWLQAPLSALAVSDDGAAVLLGSSDEADGAIISLMPDGAPRWLTRARNPVAIQFFRHKHDAMASDLFMNQVLLITDVAGSPATVTLANETQGISRPSSLAVSDDGKRVFVLNSGDRSIVALDPVSGSLLPVRCAFAPSAIMHIRQKSTLLVLDPQSDVPWLLSDDIEPRLTFVPDADKER